MKKILLSIFILLSFIKADIISDGIDLVKKESYKQDSLAGAIELYVEVFGVNPASLAQIQTAGFIDAGFTFAGSFATSTNSFSITSTIVNSQQYQKDYFTNDYARGRTVALAVSGDNFTTTYYYGRKATYSKNMKSSGFTYVQIATPVGSANQTWWNTSLQCGYFYSSGWRSLNAKKLWVFRNTTELNSTATVPNENDGAIIHDGVTLSKYLYVGGAWRLVPQTIPFSYNGTF